MPSAHIRTIPTELCRKLQFFFTDIDDTMTRDGQLPFQSLQALWELAGHGIQVVAVTGRPAGWCDYFARMWPLAGVIGENGALYFSYDRTQRKMHRRFLLGEAERSQGRQDLERIKSRVLQEVPRCKISADQAYRIADLAIDFCEDVDPLSKPEIEQICRIASEEGASYKVSSIHVNCWYGNYDKVSCVKQFLLDLSGKTLDQLQETIVFSGDSPNDEPIFKEFRHSIAVANIRNFLEELQHPPRYITEHEAADGFCEAVDTILQKRQQST
ncbi:HAD family hydrolase [candidate division KSB3 bacterium]|uniref:HAD family hydrolase n=1 Tax=candidate division KSB3 bacterium TaxID=2044937 RepID=A0A2G6E9T7_9BACT|nr:MAG: HAD family hydrolase [candidate division KSB3 bacterium]PIE29560.1 MAG: HAD family hydrolase [candidate division KSB3 bacterium]